MKTSPPPRPEAPSLTGERSTERGRRRDTHRSAVPPPAANTTCRAGLRVTWGADGCAPTTEDGGPRMPGQPGSNPSLPGQWGRMRVTCGARGRRKGDLSRGAPGRTSCPARVTPEDRPGTCHWRCRARGREPAEERPRTPVSAPTTRTLILRGNRAWAPNLLSPGPCCGARLRG